MFHITIEESKKRRIETLENRMGTNLIPVFFYSNPLFSKVLYILFMTFLTILQIR